MLLNRRLGRSASHRPRPQPRRLGVEVLEPRELLATLYVAPSGSDANPGTSASPLRSIQAAVTNASSGDEIRVAEGTYTYDPSADRFGPRKQFSYVDVLGTRAVVNLMGKQLAIRGGFSTDNFNVSDPVNNPTIIDGQGQVRGIFVLGQRPTGLELVGFTIQDCVAQGIPKRGGADAAYAFGGALFADMGGDQGDPSPWVLKNLVFLNNRAVASGTYLGDGGRAAGGAVALRYVAQASLSNIVFAGNQAVGHPGDVAGGGALGGAIHIDHSVVTGENLTFTDNTAQAGHNTTGSGVGQGGETADALGGALAVQFGSTVTLTHVTATGNRAVGGNSNGRAGSGFGGAFYAEGSDVALNLSGAFFQGNTVQGGDGATGGLANGGAIEAHSASLSLTHSHVVDNLARGGRSTTGQGGTAGGGGILIAREGGSATSTITNTVVANNRIELGPGAAAGGGGGGLYFQGAAATLDRVTIDDNRIDGRLSQGQALVVIGGSAVALANSILSNHTTGTAVLGTLTPNRVLDFNNANLGIPPQGGVIPAPATPNLYLAPGAPRWDYRLNPGVRNPAIDAAVGSSVNPGLDDGALPASSVIDFGGPPSTPGFAVAGIQALRNRKGVVGAVVQFNAAMAPKVARNLRAYRLQKISGRRLPGIASVRFQPATNSVTIKFRGPIRPGSSAALVLNAARLIDTSGRTLGGTTSFPLSG
jgi:hypothetical protein